MARDHKKYAYFYVAIPRDTVTYEKVMNDAKEAGMENETAKMLATRIRDWYNLDTRSVAGAAAVTQSPLALEPKTMPDNSAANASAALDEWE